MGISCLIFFCVGVCRGLSLYFPSARLHHVASKSSDAFIWWPYSALQTQQVLFNTVLRLLSPRGNSLQIATPCALVSKHVCTRARAFAQLRFMCKGIAYPTGKRMQTITLQVSPLHRFLWHRKLSNHRESRLVTWWEWVLGWSRWHIVQTRRIPHGWSRACTRNLQQMLQAFG
jgi:sulfite exporter TauE/SafE